MPLERVTDGLFDYAGMFPPAALNFEDALSESARFPETLHDPELVANDLVLTPEALEKLDEAALHHAGFAGRPCRVCLVGVSVQDAVAMAGRVKEFNLMRHRQNPPQRINALELHFEDEGFRTVQEAVKGARKILGKKVALYLEPKWDDERMAGGFDGVMAILDDINEGSPKVGLKVRCGGPTKLSHIMLARVMGYANHRSIPLKFTQGLHHAFAGDPRHDNKHGFLNCVFGLRLHRDTSMSLDELVACLADDEPANFVWEEGIGWRGHRVGMQSVVESASAVPFAIGSCSIHEPDAELKELQP